MSTPIPGLATQVQSSGETVQVTGGTLQTLSKARYYYFVSNKTTAANGQSLLKALKDLLDASLGGTTWTVVLTKVSGLYKIQLSHNSGSSKTITFTASLALNLGFANAVVVVANGVTVTADYPSVWWWTPDRPVGLTGPDLFDISLSYGIPESIGTAQRAPDGSVAYVQNGVLWSATYIFKAVEFMYKIRKQVGHTNEDLETWFLAGPAQGRRLLWWRDRDNATGSNAPGAGSSSPYNYIEYAPQDTLATTFPAVAAFPPNLLYYDVTLDLWVTQNGETPLTV